MRRRGARRRGAPARVAVEPAVAAVGLDGRAGGVSRHAVTEVTMRGGVRRGGAFRRHLEGGQRPADEGKHPLGEVLLPRHHPQALRLRPRRRLAVLRPALTVDAPVRLRVAAQAAPRGALAAAAAGGGGAAEGEAEAAEVVRVPEPARLPAAAEEAEAGRRAPEAAPRPAGVGRGGPHRAPQVREGRPPAAVLAPRGELPSRPAPPTVWCTARGAGLWRRLHLVPRAPAARAAVRLGEGGGRVQDADALQRRARAAVPRRCETPYSYGLTAVRHPTSTLGGRGGAGLAPPAARARGRSPCPSPSTRRRRRAPAGARRGSDRRRRRSKPH
jgi:hypothetical protein